MLYDALRPVLAFLAVALLVGAKQRNGERQPPCAGDDKRQTRAGKGIQAQDAGAAEDEGDAQDEGNGGAHVPPGETRRAHLVHAFVRGDVWQHGVVKRHGRVKADGAQHVDHQKRHSGHGDGLRQAQHHAC